MIKNTDLEKYLGRLMQVHKFEDYTANGLQIEGCEKINRIITSPSISQAVIQKAIETKAQAILVHHGFFWKNEPKVLRGNYRLKIQNILNHNINLFAYHLPMDFLPRLGNNEPVLKKLGCKKIQPFANIGYTGVLKSPVECHVFFKSLDKFYQSQGIHLSRNGEIRKIGIVSGNGVSFFQKAIEEGVDAYITGEGTEWIFQLSVDHNIAYSAMGHYKSECIGPELLGIHLQKKFKLQTDFFTEDNPF